MRGFENPTGDLTGGIQTSGNHPGRARNGDELRADLEVALAQIPGKNRINLHAIYLEADAPVCLLYTSFVHQQNLLDRKSVV